MQGKEFEFEPIRLRSVRPFIFEEFALSQVQADDESINLNSKIAVAKYLKSRVNKLIKQANDEWDELHKDDGEEAEERLLPLIRIRVRPLSLCPGSELGLIVLSSPHRSTTAEDPTATRCTRLATLSASDRTLWTA